MQFAAQDREYRRANPHGSFDVIEVDGRPAGRLYVDRRPGGPADRRHRAAAGSSAAGASAHGLIRRLQAEAAAERPDREHPRGGAQPGRAALRAARVRPVAEPRRLPPDGVDAVTALTSGERGLVGRPLGIAGRAGPGRARSRPARRGRARYVAWRRAGSPGPRKSSENCRRSCPSGPAPPRSVAATGPASGSLERDRGVGHREPISPPDPRTVSQVSHCSSTLRA